MTLKDLLADGRIRPHKTTVREVTDLFRVVDRDVSDAEVAQLSDDRRFAIAYNAALQLGIIALHAAGYRPVGTGHHWATFHVLPEIMGQQHQIRADYFDNCRSKRNVTDYDRAGEISTQEAEEILSEVRLFRGEVLAWLRENHPALFPKEAGW
jgi:hypothetical protein